MSKLLNRSLRAFVIYAIIVLACSIPVYYIIVDLIWKHELKEHNLIVSNTIKENITATSLTKSELAGHIAFWNTLLPDMRLQAVTTLQPDSTYDVYRYNKHAAHNERFQGLVTYFNINNQPYSLAVESNIEETHETIIAITIVTLLFSIILLGGLYVMNRRMSVKLWRSFYESLEKIKAFDLNSQENIRFDATDIIEFQELNDSLNKLIGRNIVVYKQQKEFIENASHELQTPLSIIQSKLDLLSQAQALTEKQSQVIDEARKALARINRINKNLLLLAKIENNQFLVTETISINDVLQEILSLLSDFIMNKQMIVTQALHADITIDCNRILAESMLTNLVMNAVRHNTGSDIYIAIRDGGFIISNMGTCSLDNNRLFKRFSSVSNQIQGTGLGLSIVLEICKRYGWVAAYEFIDNRHQFSISF